VLEITQRTSTLEDLAIGRGEPSGKDGQWRVIGIPDVPLTVYYEDGSPRQVADKEAWNQLPLIGVQIITGEGFVAKNADEYVWRGEQKFGLYADDEVYERVFREALNG